jgi:uncharacterized protein YacL
VHIYRVHAARSGVILKLRTATWVLDVSNCLLAGSGVGRLGFFEEGTMNGHVRALAVMQIVYASMGLLLGLVVFMLFGGIAGIVTVSAPFDESIVAVPILTIIGGVAGSVLILLSLPRLLAGIGLLKLRGWGRVLTMVVSVIGLIDFPFGTALGIYGLWVMTNSDTQALFERRAAVV